ncbi:hypothetical protein ACFL3Z_01655 [Gemmatimonadota bacterium]
MLDRIGSRRIQDEVAEQMRLAVDHYFQFSAQELFEGFWEALRGTQVLSYALTGAYFDGDALRKVPFGRSISIFQGQTGRTWGYVAPSGVMVDVELAFTNKRVPEALKEIAQYLGETETGSEIRSSLHAYCRFLARARTHASEGRGNEGFLHFIIALDLLLAGREGITATLSRRAAVLTHRAFGVPFKEQVELLERLYHGRSRYVHEGEDVPEEYVAQAEKTCVEIGYCLLRLARKGLGNQVGFVKRWHKNLDYVVSAIEADRHLRDEEFKEIGSQ